MALSPLLVFVAVYLVSALVAGDFYKVPISAAFMVASIYAIATTRDPGHGATSIERRVAVFSRGAGDKDVLLMIWIFILAGAFAQTATQIGAVEATVELTLAILPGKLLLAGLFLASCFVSMSIGTSVGTIVALVPIASGIAGQTGLDNAMASAIIVGGAFFGDNLSFISDTTIASTRTQGCSMADKFRANIWIAGPAAIAVTVLYVLLGMHLDASAQTGSIDWLRLTPYLMVIILAISGVSVMVVLCLGIALNLVIGLVTGSMGWLSFLSAAGEGIAGMGDLIIVTLLAGGMLGVIKHNGGLDFLIRLITKRIHGKRGAEASIALLVGLCNLCTANNTIAIITVGGIAKDISARYGVDPRKSASLLDTFSCIVQGVIPYGAQLLMASSLAGLSPVGIIGHLYYPMALSVVSILSIAFLFPRKYS